ncbi:Hypothetical protein D9617_18g034830 [Elsinoe fawcettii]|nr:Hypothetical protein D9617_18g034830 [Elsinoe fawcettii]
MPPKKGASTKKRKSDATVTSPEAKRPRTKDPKDSHLYTDDNPETTLHGTGFKDKATALHTLELVSQRSLTYQFQTINTMLHRARGHAHKTAGIKEAIEIFQEWIEGYKQRKSDLRQFPLLSKPKVKSYLERYDEGEFGPKKELEQVEGMKHAEEFARLYVELEPRKRLANMLVDNAKPEGEDWDIRRYKHLCDLVDEKKKWETEDLWIDERDRRPLGEHLVLIFWSWSPSKKA